jgi:hypothetical protein
MNEDDRHEDTPPTGVHIPRPQVRKAAVTTVMDTPLPAPPKVPTIEDVYRLIDERLQGGIPIDVVERFSSVPPAEVKPTPSMPVRAAKFTGRLYAYVVAAAISILQIIATAALPEYRGPIVQATKLAMLVVAEVFKDDPTALPSLDTPELLPEPVSPPPPRDLHEPDLAPPPP